MAGAIHKMAVYLGLVEDEVAYEDGFESVEEDFNGYEDEEGGETQAVRSPVPAGRAAYAAARRLAARWLRHRPCRARPSCAGTADRRSHADHNAASAHIQ